MTHVPHIFDSSLLLKHRQRALNQRHDDADFLWRELANRLIDRLGDVRREFPAILEIGSHHGKLRPMLMEHWDIQHYIQLDPLPSAPSIQICAHGELLPIKAESFDLIISIASLQWVNDLPGCLMQMRRALKPDGLLIAIIPGEGTLFELRRSMDAATLALKGGGEPRISPMLGLKDAADLMQRAGFALPVVDLDHLSIEYSSPLKLMQDLRAMGQTNALVKKTSTPLTKQLLKQIIGYYQQHFPAANDGVRASFDFITLTGWAPAESQTKPLPRGSGQVSMKDIL